MSWRFAGCELDPAARTLLCEGLPVPVEPKVFDLLVYLLERRQRHVPREELMEQLWPDAVVGPAALSRAVKEARRAVGDDGQAQAVIATLHGRGYRFVAEVVRVSTGAQGPGPRRSAPPDQPTVPRARTVSGSAEFDRPVLAIAWVFPEPGPALPCPSQGALVFGRDAACDVVLRGGDASRRHARMAVDGPIYVLSDLHSTNGTFVNGKRIETAALTGLDVVRLGDAVGVVVAGSPDSPDAYRALALADGLVGSALLAATIEPLRAASPSPMPVVLEGETGVGKESVARAVHAWSGRSGRFVATHCAELTPAALVEAVTAATSGTLLLDYVLELPEASQAKLLAFLDGRAEGVDPSLDVRLVATTLEPLRKGVSQGTLRADLCARLSGASVRVPPLRERSWDVPALLAHFLRRQTGGSPPTVSAGLIECLCRYDWPFNVRELETLVRGLLLTHSGGSIRSSALPDHVRGGASGVSTASSSVLGQLAAALREHGGSLEKASAELGLSRGRVRELMNRGE